VPVLEKSITEPLGWMFRDPRLNPLPKHVDVTSCHIDERLESRLSKVPKQFIDLAKETKAGHDIELKNLMTRFRASETEIVAGHYYMQKTYSRFAD
jgi:ethanolamine utilization cobalamin adenosyltransferase